MYSSKNNIYWTKNKPGRIGYYSKNNSNWTKNK